MASNLNSEFNYRYQVMGCTPWEKLKNLKNFLIGRKEAAAMEKVFDMKHRAFIEEFEDLKKDPNVKPYVILRKEAEVIESLEHLENQKHAFQLAHAEVAILEKLIAELYVELNPTRLYYEDGSPYSDDEMFEVNANLEFTVMIGREIQSEIIANGRPSAAKILNAMSNPQTLEMLQCIGLIPPEISLLTHTEIFEKLSNDNKNSTNLLDE
jgi:hypothetical protein